MTAPNVSALAEKFRARDAMVGIIGMGYVGLPLMLACTKAGFRVIGFDIDGPKVDALNQGKSPLKHIGDSKLAARRDAGMFEATTDFDRLHEPDAILICVPTPLGRHREPDLSYVEDTARQVSSRLRCNQLVVLESTTWPGTTREVVQPILENGGLKSGTDFFLAFSPEREDPGNIDFETSLIPKVVGADDCAARQLACLLYEQFVTQTVPVASASTAEAVKLTENIFRAVNIALVNELKIVYDAMGINIFDVIEAAKTKPFGYMPFYPGPGLGGHCIPIDPFYLTWKAREVGMHTRFIELAGEINHSMPSWIVQQTAKELDSRFHRGLNRSRILLVGLAYKPNVDDIRESPALSLWSLLERRGALVCYYDPHVPQVPITREHPEITGAGSITLSAEILATFDACIIVTDHEIVDYALILRSSRLVVDTRNAMASRFGAQANVAQA